MCFTKRIIGHLKLKLYNQQLERVKPFLGLLFDERFMWVVHIQKIIDKYKKVKKFMRW